MSAALGWFICGVLFTLVTLGISLAIANKGEPSLEDIDITIEALERLRKEGEDG